MKKRQPPKLAQVIVYCPVPEDRKEYVLDLRMRYRDRLRLEGEKQARSFAYREAFGWMWGWVSDLIELIRGSFS
jgi:hypothetical protein